MTHAGVLVEGENYEIRHLFKVSEHCCRWLKRRSRTASRLAPVYRERTEGTEVPKAGLLENATLGNPQGGSFSASAVGCASEKKNRLQQVRAERGLTIPQLTRRVCA